MIDIEMALQLRQETKTLRQRPPRFSCIECLEQVDPHNQGKKSPAHFEHRQRNPQCSLSVPINSQQTKIRPQSWITTTELANRTAGGTDYIRTKKGIVKGLALRTDLNENAPNVVVVGKGARIEHRAKLLLETAEGVPTYIKRSTNAWELIGTYRAIAYKQDAITIKRYCGSRSIENIAGILFLERTDEVTLALHGGGYPSPEARKRVEIAAINHAQNYFESIGYTIYDHQLENQGYDLLAQQHNSALKLEVKGTSGNISRFFITRNERKCANNDSSWRLVVVTNALTKPIMQIFTWQEAESKYNFDAIAWDCTPKK